MKKIFNIQTIVFIVILCLPSLLHAQGPSDPGGDPSGGGAPIDGGLSLLVAGGVGYGIKKVKRQK